MPELGPEHPLTYREEVVAPLFQAIRAGDSCVVVGPASMGKSRLLHHITRADVRRHGLGDQAATYLLVIVDGNRQAELSEWGLYELLLTALVEVAGGHASTASLRAELAVMQREAITSRDALLVRRHVELAVRMFCQEHGLSLCLILDEFDDNYRAMPAPALANLRALRDRTKYQLSYVLMLREHPARLRPPAECEGFYELCSRVILGLRPYTTEDSKRVLAQLEARKGRELPPTAHTQLLRLSGGHPGLLVALFDAVRAAEPHPGDWLSWALDQPAIREECGRLWGGLAEDERLALAHLTQRLDTTADMRDILLLKGLVAPRDGAMALFSPLFAEFVLANGTLANGRLLVDEPARIVWLGERAIRDLTAREFDLLAFLYRHADRVCTRDQLLEHLYPGEAYSASDNRVDTLVKRVRGKIEPMREVPRYLMTVRGKGYKLISAPDSVEGTRAFL